MIKNRKEMYAYIRQDMKRNFMCGGGQNLGLKFY